MSKRSVYDGSWSTPRSAFTRGTISKKSAYIFSLFAVLVLLLAAAGCGGSTERQGGSKDEAVPVVIAAARVGVLSDGSTLSGRLQALSSADVVPKMGGKVGEIKVDVGSRVKKGDVMIKLDAPELAAAVRQAEAGLAAAEAKFEVSKASYERGKALLEEGAVSQAEFDSKFALAYKADKEQVEMSRAQLEAARANYSNSIITAPIDGVVTARRINPGEMASPTMPVVTIVNLDKVVVETNVSEDLVNTLEVGQEVEVKVAAASDKPFTGEITNIALAADKATKAFPIKIQIENKSHILKPGMFAEVKLGGGTEALLVPRDAVMSGEEGDFVFVVENGTAKRRGVITGASDGKSIVITSGLEEGEEVVAVGQHYLEDGMKVNTGGVSD